MANQPEEAVYAAGVFQLETSTLALGGVGGPANTPLLNLANRTAYLKSHMDALEAGTVIPPTVAPLNSPALTGTPTAPTAAIGTNTDQIATMAALKAAADALLDAAPGTLDTLKKLASAIADDPNFATTMATALAGKLGKSGDTMTGALVIALSALQLTLRNSNNTADSVVEHTRFLRGSGAGVRAALRSVRGATNAVGDVYLTFLSAADAVLQQYTFGADGKLLLPTDPTAALGAATKQYVDATVITQIVSGYRNLKIVSADGGTSSIITCAAITLEGAGGVGKRFDSVNKTLNLANSGDGGIDTGSVASGNWYYEWIIGKADGTVDVLGSLSSTAPTMPSGYTYKAYVGAVLTKSGSAVLVGSIHYGNMGYRTATPLPKMISGSSGNVSTGPRMAVAVADYVPPTASHILGIVNGGGGITLVAPNNTYGAYNSTTNAAPAKEETDTSGQFCLALESSNIYYASSGDSRAGLYATGWRDNNL
ncbi:hypothetical protein [Parvibaculum sp.]|uniref:hypothetical protein n=1 Tax=Parvibaculum sp. TaxID=2024848 RepID=UPI002734752B|nr:hypothetical protein [Parvibaculum sp.]MDP3327216.1 hypothetical protein [Parvibaculum sp.]